MLWESGRGTAIRLILILAATLWVFRGSLDNPFHFDDNLFLQSPQVTEPGDPWYLLQPAQTRQLTYLTFYWNYRLGGTRPIGYHAVNLALHLANVLLLYIFVALVIRRKSYPRSDPDSVGPFLRRWLPAAAAAVFALHPIQSEAVNYVYQRSTLLAAFFSLISMISFLRARISRNRIGWTAACGAGFLLAVASKEWAVVLPLVWIALSWAETGGFESVRQFFHRLRWLMPAAFLAAGLLVYRAGSERLLVFGKSSIQYMLAQIQVFASYVWLVLMPLRLSVDHGFAPAPVFSIYALVCMLLLAAVVITAAVAGKRNPTVAFFILTFLIFLMPTSSVVPSPDLMFEHRLYLPMAGAATLIAWTLLAGAQRAFARASRIPAACLMCFGLLLGWYGFLSMSRTYVWGDNVRLWQDAVEKAPDKPRAHYNLGVSWLDRDHDRARGELLRTVELDPHYAAALYNLGWLAQADGDYANAKKFYAMAIRAEPNTWQAHQNLGNLAVLQGSYQDAAREFREAIRLNPECAPAQLNLAKLQLKTGDTRGALGTLKDLKQSRWDLLEARYLSAVALVEDERFSEAAGEIAFIVMRDSHGVYRNRIEDLRSRFPAEVNRSGIDRIADRK